MSTPDDIERICEIMTRYGATRVRLGSVEIELPRAGAAPVASPVADQAKRPGFTSTLDLPTTMDELRKAVLPQPAEEVG